MLRKRPTVRCNSGISQSWQYRRVLLTENGTFDFQKFVSVVFRKGEGHGHGGRITEAIEAFDRDENGFISADESRRVLTSLIESTGEDEMIPKKNPAREHRGGETEFLKKSSADWQPEEVQRQEDPGSAWRWCLQREQRVQHLHETERKQN